MTSSKKNDILFNAAISGITAGVLGGKDIGPVSAATLADAGGLQQQAAILAAATALDIALGFDATLSVSSSDGTLLVTEFAGSGTAAEILPVFSKPVLVYGLCKAAYEGLTPISAVGASYAVINAGIVAQYTVSVAQLAAS